LLDLVQLTSKWSQILSQWLATNPLLIVGPVVAEQLLNVETNVDIVLKSEVL
jgi:hypothetical protein